VVIITTVIAAMTTIVAAALGALPQYWGLRAGDKAPASAKTTIRGWVLSKDGQRPKSNVEVLLQPTDGRLTGKTEPDGQFMFAGLPSGEYRIIVREPDGKSVSTYLDEGLPELPLPDADTLIRYSIRNKGDK
jgi:hypothetical protein